MSSGPPVVSFDAFPNEQVKIVGSLEELIATPWSGNTNALCWRRRLIGDFGEVARAVNTTGDSIVTLDEAFLRRLPLSRAGQRAVDLMLRDLVALQERNLLPELNWIRAYPREEEPGPIPLDVYSFHADSATIETDTFLCTYFGRPSEAVRNDEIYRYSDRSEIRSALLTEFAGPDDSEFQRYLREVGYDLHYGVLPGARPFSFGVGNLWRIATDNPASPVPPCIHRAPATHADDPPRLLLIS